LSHEGNRSTDVETSVDDTIGSSKVPPAEFIMSCSG
jgi:hypothetical protein